MWLIIKRVSCFPISFRSTALQNSVGEEGVSGAREKTINKLCGDSYGAGKALVGGMTVVGGNIHSLVYPVQCLMHSYTEQACICLCQAFKLDWIRSGTLDVEFKVLALSFLKRLGNSQWRIRGFLTLNVTVFRGSPLMPTQEQDDSATKPSSFGFFHHPKNLSTGIFITTPHRGCIRSSA